MFTTETAVCFLEQLVSETLNSAIVDSGCNKTVCGQNWLKCFVDSLPPDVDLQEGPSSNSFQFGPSPVYKATKQVNLPVNIGGIHARVRTDVIDGEIPFLLSKSSLKEAEAVLDFVNDVLVVTGGRKIQLEHTSNGHYAIPIGSKEVALFGGSTSHIEDAVFTEKENPFIVYMNYEQISTGDISEKRAIAKKLHLQFGHPVDSNKLKSLCQDAGVTDESFLHAIDDVTEACNTCSRFRKAKSRPVVSLPMASDFNEIMALDLKFVTMNNRTTTILHMIDIFTRYSAGVVVKSKEKHVIVQAILKHWVAIFGTPASLFSDNGGEFNNALLRDVAELLNTKVMATAAYSPWSNGIVERHNAVIENMILKIVHDSNCSVETALLWSLCAKNSLHNNRGYSPNQLVFGRNPNLPSVLTSKLPALRTVTPSKLISEHLSALNASREAFVQSEASAKLKKAIHHQTRTVTNKVYKIGDEVLYKRPGQKEWHGPGTIFGVDGSVTLVRHGGATVSVHPCDLTPYREEVLENQPAAPSTQEVRIQEPVSQKTNAEVYVSVDVADFIELSDADKTNTGDELSQHGNQSQQNEIQSSIINDHVLLEDAAEHDDTNHNVPVTADQEPAIALMTPSSSSTPVTPPAIPNVGDRISFTDPDTNEVGKFLVTGRAGKVSGGNRYWRNVKNLADEMMKSIDFSRVEDWQLLPDEVLFNFHDSAEVLQAQNDEFERWNKYDVYEEVEDEGQEAISTRWVVTEKPDGSGGMKMKARLVARGFEEDSSDIRCDSPTITKENLRLVATISTSHSWTIHSMDITAAFLQGMPIERTVYLIPPKEACTDKLWKLKKAVYGLSDASRQWYDKVKEELLKKGVVKSTYDGALFIWRQGDTLKGIFCCHVDDFFYAGSPDYHQTVIAHLRHCFSLSSEDTTIITYTGISFSQFVNSISMHQNEFIQTLQPITIENLPSSGEFNAKQIRQVRSLVGQMQWVAKLTRPDIAFAVCDLSSRSRRATMAEVKDANKTLRKLQNISNHVHIPDIGDLSKASIIAYSDASHKILTDGHSQGGFVIFLQGENGKAAPVTWKSHRLKRVVKSAMAAETMALIEAAEHSYFIKRIIQEIYNLETNTVPIICIIDSKQTYDAVSSSNVIEDKRCLVDVCAAREMIERGEVKEVRRLPKELQLADGLTKSTASSNLLMKVLSGEESLPTHDILV
jgi:hypothetical protein